jgi:polysaccharide export outer membrane protein
LQAVVGHTSTVRAISVLDIQTRSVNRTINISADLFGSVSINNTGTHAAVTVLPDGRIAFPLIGQLTAAGKTLGALTGEIEQKLARYVPDMTLNVSVQQVNSMWIYIIGKVNGPGRFNLNTDVSVLQALAMAGGLNAFAKRGDIKIFREQADGGTQILPFDYDRVADGEDIRQIVKLRRGDVVVVP